MVIPWCAWPTAPLGAPAVDYLGGGGIRDYLDYEKLVHAFLGCSIVGYFLVDRDRVQNKGYAGLYLEPFVARYPDIACGYVLNIRWLSGGAAQTMPRWPHGWRRPRRNSTVTRRKRA